MNTFSITLPMPPSSNNLFATDFKTKRRFITKDYTKWRECAAKRIADSHAAQGAPTFDRHLQLIIHVGLDYRSDVCGRVKAIEDLLVKSIPGFPDDRYIDRLEVERVPGIKGARVQVIQLAPPQERRA